MPRKTPNRGGQNNGNNGQSGNGNGPNQGKGNNPKSRSSNGNNGNSGNGNNNPRNVLECTYCGKKGHTQQNCRLDPSNAGNNNNSNNAAPTNTPFSFSYATNNGPAKPTNSKPAPSATTPQAAPKPVPTWVPMQGVQQSGTGSQTVAVAIPTSYCAFCNALTHKGDDCTNHAAFVTYHTSVLNCKTCGVNGHLASECKNPFLKKCKKCNRSGHVEKNCLNNPSMDPKEVFRAALTSVGVSSSNFSGGPQAMEMRRELNEEIQKQAAAGTPLPKKEIDRCEYLIALKGAEECCAASNLPSVPKSNPKTWPTAVKSLPSYNPKFTFTPDDIAKMRQAGFSGETITEWERFCREQKEKEKTELQIALQNKIEASLCYPKSCITTAIRGQENWIMENQLLTRMRMDQIKMALSRGANIWRDPTAMRALVHRQRPQCNCCGSQGEIYDRHFSEISPVITEQDILRLDDIAQWGLAVGFGCWCSIQKGYKWVDVLECELIALEEKANEAKVPCSRSKMI